MGSQSFVYLCILGAGFVGACLRYLCGLIPLPNPDGFPTNTLMINIVGSYFIFLVFQHAGQRLKIAPQLIKIINTGLLGAFTTLSAFCVESITLFNQGQYALVALYMLLTYVLSFGAVLLAVFTCDILAMRRLKKLQRIRRQRALAREAEAVDMAAEGQGSSPANSSDATSEKVGEGEAR